MGKRQTRTLIFTYTLNIIWNTDRGKRTHSVVDSSVWLLRKIKLREIGIKRSAHTHNNNNNKTIPVKMLLVLFRFDICGQRLSSSQFVIRWDCARLWLCCEPTKNAEAVYFYPRSILLFAFQFGLIEFLTFSSICWGRVWLGSI